MLSRDMTFPQTFQLDRDWGSIKGVVTGVTTSTYGQDQMADIYHGYMSIRGDPNDRVPTIWDKTGKAVYVGGGGVPSGMSRNLRFPPAQGQKEYDSLSVDQKAILRLIRTSNDRPVSRANLYLRDLLKVDVNLATKIIDIADNKDNQ
jgi:hypothetical protein